MARKIFVLVMLSVVEGDRRFQDVDPAPMEAQVTVLLNMFDEPSRRQLGWGVSAPCQDGPYPGWKGVSCNQESTGIVMINIPNFGVNGTLPSMANLTTLSDLLLSGNGIVGSIPSSLPPHLHTLDISSNYLNGTIPSTLSNVSSLERVDLSANSLYGSIPFMGSLKSLTYVGLGDNALIGTIPSELTGLKFLKTVSLFGNNLQGTIPPGLGALPAISIVYLYNNKLSGTVPADLGESTSLLRLYLDTNRLTGVPPAFSNVHKGKLEKITLADNSWKCPLPGISDTVWIDKADTTCNESGMPVWVVACFIAGGVLLLIATVVFVRKLITKKHTHQVIMYSSEEPRDDDLYVDPPPAHLGSSSRSQDPTVTLFAGVSSSVFNPENDDSRSRSPATPSRLPRPVNTSFVKSSGGSFNEHY